MITRDEFVQTVTDTMLCTPHGNDPVILVIEYDRLTAELAKCEPIVMAFGMLACLKPDEPMNINHPIEMANRIIAHIQSERAELAQKGDAVENYRLYLDASAEIDRLNAVLKSLEDAHHETIAYVRDETQQFNEGYEAFEHGESNDNAPHYDHDYDQWLVGWAWAQYVHTEAANRDDDDLDQYDSLIPEGK